MLNALVDHNNKDKKSMSFGDNNRIGIRRKRKESPTTSVLFLNFLCAVIIYTFMQMMLLQYDYNIPNDASNNQGQRQSIELRTDDYLQIANNNQRRRLLEEMQHTSRGESGGGDDTNNRRRLLEEQRRTELSSSDDGSKRSGRSAAASYSKENDQDHLQDITNYSRNNFDAYYNSTNSSISDSSNRGIAVELRRSKESVSGPDNSYTDEQKSGTIMFVNDSGIDALSLINGSSKMQIDARDSNLQSQGGKTEKEEEKRHNNNYNRTVASATASSRFCTWYDGYRYKRQACLPALKRWNIPSSSFSSTSDASEQKKDINILVVVNPLDHERYFCGKRIPPMNTVYFDMNNIINGDNTTTTTTTNEVSTKDDLSCFLQDKESMLSMDSFSSMFPLMPTLDNKQRMTPPVQLEPPYPSNKKLPSFDNIPLTTSCDVPCQDRGSLNQDPQRKVVVGTPWQIYTSMEGPAYYRSLRFDEMAHVEDKYYSTTSFKSEIPLIYMDLNEPNTIRDKYPPVKYETAIRGASFIARNCHAKNNREDLVRFLMQFMRNHTSSSSSADNNNNLFQVDSLSACWHNADPPPNTSIDDKTSMMRSYLFHLAFENQCEDDYITEKLWGALEAGTVPVYFGPPNIYEHLPGSMRNSIINVHDFDSYEQLGEHLLLVANNQTLYESYHAWRKEPLPLSFLQKYNFTKTHSTCRTCRWAFAKKYGLGWDQPSQTVQDLHLSRKLCWNTKKKDKQQQQDEQLRREQVADPEEKYKENTVTHPFQESWLILPAANTSDDKKTRSQEMIPQPVTSKSANSEEECELNSLAVFKSFISLNGISSSIHRIIQYHDGIIDMIVLVEEEDSSLAFEERRSQKVLQNHEFVLQLDMVSSLLMASSTKDTDKQHNDIQNNSENNNNITFKQFGKRESFIQNDVSRMTILTDWDVAIESPSDGILHIPIALPTESEKQSPANTPTNNALPKNGERKLTTNSATRNKSTKRRIRFIVENVDTFYEGGSLDSYYYFGSVMMKDFFNPINKFVIMEEENEAAKNDFTDGN